VFSRRRWRTPWSSETSGEPPAAGTPTVTVIPPGAAAPAGSGTARGGAGAPGATSWRPGGAQGSPGSSGSSGAPGWDDPPSTRVIRIPASVGIGQAGESAPALGGAEATRQRSRSAPTTRDAQSAEEPAGSERYGRIALAVITVATVCALLGVLAALAATVGRGTSSGPGPAVSIPPEGATTASGRAGIGVSGVGANHGDGRHGDSGHSSAAPLRTAPGAAAPRAPAGAARGVTGKPAARPTSTGGAGRGAGRPAHHRQVKRATPRQHDRKPVHTGSSSNAQVS
jgi:hypothetical protein